MGQAALILGCEGTGITAAEAVFYREVQPWGFILFARNVAEPDQLRRLTGDLRAAVGRDAAILIDQEGGRVQRLRAPHWREWLPPLDHVAAAGDQAERAMELRYRIIADELRGVGIDANCAPVIDVATGATHPFLKNRCYSDDPDRVARVARAVANGLLAGGVLPITKHVPGHGRAVSDSHLECPQVDTALRDLNQIDFRPVRALADLPMAMTSHVVYAALDDQPATHSAKVIDFIRRDLGVSGLLLSDDISMQALAGTVAERGAAALKAGCDIVVHSNGKMAEMQAMAVACGAMTEAAQARADAALRARVAPDAIDIAAVEAELQALLQDVAHG